MEFRGSRGEHHSPGQVAETGSHDVAGAVARWRTPILFMRLLIILVAGCCVVLCYVVLCCVVLCCVVLY